MRMGKVVIIMGSKNDVEWSGKIESALRKFGIDVVMRVSSAHKTPLKCLDVIRECEKEGVVFITVAGRSNALSGFVDAQTPSPVIACPPYSEKFSGSDIFSSLRMPSAVAPLVILEPEGAALAAAKILGLRDGDIYQSVKTYQDEIRKRLEEDDSEVASGKR
jgi:5-(carboxyamino)imidazole ribonucleotide mutase